MNIIKNKYFKREITNLGFRDFNILSYEHDLVKIIDNDDNRVVKIIDVFPEVIKKDFLDCLNLYESFVFEKNRIHLLREKWKTIIYKFSCYFRLNHILLFAMGNDSNSYCTEFSPSTDVSFLIEKVETLADPCLYFIYKEIGIYITLSFDDFYKTVISIDEAAYSDKYVDILKALTEA